MSTALNLGSVMCDVTVWFEYTVGSSPELCREATNVIGALTTAGTQIWVASSALGDLTCLLPRELERARASQLGPEVPLAEGDRRALEECTRASITHVMDLARVAGIGQRECERARELWPRLADFGRNLVVAAAESVGAARIVSYDEVLRRAYPEICVEPRSFLLGSNG